ncbi:sarcosine oxidase subunit alpha [Sphingomonas jinjuensis]|uniref:Sarcosine oxidase subunit alpha n=1 Tax=Sphingomonas jinjuensis TaxID=535907 RepID=A0A840FIX7_9SPHN|nr:sarcosine oxidase subunit alpha family protein [Sphingomonas jinjuensis]MBB4155657.1 sarcosine oxidase subunit alpha [Sphingomonas jinjuensis]
MSVFRTAGGDAIDRSRTISFSFDGTRIEGHPGDTIASALLANGVHLMGRSFKYHRPRGVLGAGTEEPNALVGVTRGPGRFEPNQRATLVPITDGMVVESQNRSPSLARDIGAVNDLLSAFIPAGFYYKTFMWPRSFWAKVYEPVIRRAAGLGRPPEVTDPDRYAQRWAHCETLVVGAGPAGLAAALAAADAGGRVILCDEGETIGGRLRDMPRATIDGLTAGKWIVQARTRLENAGVRLLTRTTAYHYGIGNLVTLAQRCTDAGGARTRERQWMVRAGRVIIAIGSIERPIVFPNNDRPGVMLASAAAGFLHRYGVLVGRHIVIATQHDSAYRTAIDLAGAGAAVTLVDRRARPAADLGEACSAAGVTVITGHIPIDTRGRLRVSKVAIAPAPDAAHRWLPCDALLMAGGWTPSVHLHSQSGGKVAWDAQSAAFLPGTTLAAQVSAGTCRGRVTLADCLADGWTAGGGNGASAPAADDRTDTGMSPAEPDAHPEGARRKAFVDFQNDVTAKDIRLAVREGFRSVEHLKRYTTNGMATDQGRTSNINALAIAAQAMGQTIPGTGLTTFRAPYSPTTFGTMTGFTRGRLFDPVRTTPMHARAVAAGAVFEDVGQWKRARFFPRPGEDMHAATARECISVREAVGLFDASTLGKIEVVGPDAAAFLDLLYAGRLSTLAVGRCRYALMLREDGFIADDGVIARLATDRFHVTTTSGGAASVLNVMEDFRQTEWPDLRVWLTSTTEQWAVAGVTGPRARNVLAALVEGVDLSSDAFPHMAVRQGRIAGVPVRIFRVSFTGETGYEINVPARHALPVWDAVAAAVAAAGGGLYGTEAAHVLRAEKGYIIVGQETDGTATPDDVGLGKMVAATKPDFVGKRSLMRAAMRDPDRKQLVALLTADRSLLDEGTQVVDPASPRQSLGHVSSTYPSVTLGRPFALAMVHGGRSLLGTKLAVATAAGPVAVDVVDPVLYDPSGARLDV